MTARRPLRIPPSLAAWALVAVLPLGATAGEPVDRLLGRVPPGAAMAVIVEDLGDRIRDMNTSPFFRGLVEGGPARAWLDSEEGTKLRRARRDVEAALAAPIERVVEGLLGRAVVLSLHLPPDAPGEAARGLLQTAVTDAELLDRFIAVVNAAELGSGALRRVESRRHAGVSYSVRDFGDGRPDEAYALLDDGTFVWTNAEELLRAVIDRAADPSLPGLTGVSAIDRARRALPERPIASLLLDPRFVARLAESEPEAGRLGELPGPLADYLGAIDALGAALEWRDGPVLHLVEALDPDRLPAPVRSWAARPGDAAALLPTIPDSALVAGAGHVDAAALHDLVLASMPGSERPRLEAFAEVVRGLALGRDPRSELLPSVGPGVVGWIDPPAEGRPLRRAPAVIVVALGDAGVAEAIDNALRTALAFFSLDDGRKVPLRLVSRAGDGARVTALVPADDPGAARFAYAVGRGLIAVGTDLDAVASALSDRSEARADRLSPALVARARFFPEATTFAYLDLAALHRLAGDRRDELARLLASLGDDAEVGSVRADLDRVLDLLAPFRAVYVTSSLSADATLARRMIGLVVAE